MVARRARESKGSRERREPNTAEIPARTSARPAEKAAGVIAPRGPQLRADRLDSSPETLGPRLRVR